MPRKLYRQGLESISVDEVEEGVDSFYDAWDGWPLFRNEEVSGRPNRGRACLL
jgi:hypothetical protein